MDVILPYVVWITILAYAMDWSLQKMSKLMFPWYYGMSRRAVSAEPEEAGAQGQQS
jgi:hypothetical protein